MDLSQKSHAKDLNPCYGEFNNCIGRCMYCNKILNLAESVTVLEFLNNLWGLGTEWE
jgi:hypothetical protein